MAHSLSTSIQHRAESGSDGYADPNSDRKVVEESQAERYAQRDTNRYAGCHWRRPFRQTWRVSSRNSGNMIGFFPSLKKPGVIRCHAAHWLEPTG